MDGEGTGTDAGIRTMRPCLEPGCGMLVERGRCPEHAQERQRAAHRSYDRRRPKTAARGYGGAWQKLSRAYLQTHWLCEDCGHRKAVLVDHVKPIKEGGAMLDPWNLQALCWSCHERKKHVERVK